MTEQESDTAGGPLVSLVMTTWNGAAFLEAQLDSLARQTHRPLELIAHDDGSQDDTPAMLEAFAARAPFPVRVRRNEARLGYAANFTGAARAARGEVLMFVDQDDVWHADKVARIVAALADDPRADVVTHDFAVFNEQGVLVPSFFAELRAHGFPADNNVKGCATAFTRRFIDQWGWPEPDDRFSHDVWVCVIGEAVGARRLLDAVLIDHRLHGGNASGWLPAADGKVRPSLVAEADRPDFVRYADRYVNRSRAAAIPRLQDMLRRRARPEQAAAAERAVRHLGLIAQRHARADARDRSIWRRAKRRVRRLLNGWRGRPSS